MIKIFTYQLNNEMVSDEDLQRTLSMSQNSNYSVETTSINHFKVPIDTIGKLLSSYHNCEYIVYDPKIPIEEEMFVDFYKSSLLNDCWVPISWNENGIVALVGDPSNIGKMQLSKQFLIHVI